MNSDWPLRKLGDITRSLNAKRVPVSSLERQKRQGSYRYYGASGVVDYIDDFIFDGTYLLVSEDGENLRTRNTPIAFKVSGKYWVNNHAHILDETEPGVIDFVEHAFRHLDISAYITGAVQPKLNKRSLQQIELRVPNLEERYKINNLLGSLDDKIELNRRMNETLEEMARALFRDWFIDFGPTRRQMDGATDPAAIMGHAFPNDKAATLAPLFPARLAENGLPEGWGEKPLDEIAHFLNGLALQKYPAHPDQPDLPVIKIAELRSGVTAKTNRASKRVPEKYVIRNGDFIFSWSGSLLAKFWTGGPGALNQHLFKVTSKTHPMWFVSEWVHAHLEEFQRIASAKAVTMGHIKRSHLSEAMCICPSTDRLEMLGAVFKPLIRKQIVNDEESQTLAEMRDLLLPKLMSGEIRLKDAPMVQDTLDE